MMLYLVVGMCSELLVFEFEYSGSRFIVSVVVEFLEELFVLSSGLKGLLVVFYIVLWLLVLVFILGMLVLLVMMVLVVCRCVISVLLCVGMLL